jgi:hypothetical protein
VDGRTVDGRTEPEQANHEPHEPHEIEPEDKEEFPFRAFGVFRGQFPPSSAVPKIRFDPFKSAQSVVKISNIFG